MMTITLVSRYIVFNILSRFKFQGHLIIKSYQMNNYLLIMKTSKKYVF